MKKLFLTLLLLFTTITIYSQETETKKTEKKGDFIEVKLFYENGMLMQHGFYTKDGKLHGSWESYNSDGSRKCYATYNYGVKVGVWTYWDRDKITKVVYDNNKVISVEEVSPDNKPKTNY